MSSSDNIDETFIPEGEVPASEEAEKIESLNRRITNLENALKTTLEILEQLASSEETTDKKAVLEKIAAVKNRLMD